MIKINKNNQSPLDPYEDLIRSEELDPYESLLQKDYKSTYGNKFSKIASNN